MQLHFENDAAFQPSYYFIEKKNSAVIKNITTKAEFIIIFTVGDLSYNLY